MNLARRRSPESCEVEMSNLRHRTNEFLRTSSGEPRRSDKRCGCYTTRLALCSTQLSRNNAPFELVD